MEKDLIAKTNGKKILGSILVSIISLIIFGTIFLADCFIVTISFTHNLFFSFILIALALLAYYFLKNFFCEKFNLKPFSYFAAITVTTTIIHLCLLAGSTLFQSASAYLVLTFNITVATCISFIIFLVLGFIKLFKKSVLKGVLTIVVVLLVCVTIVVPCALYLKSHPTHVLYNDDFVIGNTKENIVEHYGEPDREQPNRIYYLVDYLIDPEYYMVEFDENGKAVSVELWLGPILKGE